MLKTNTDIMKNIITIPTQYGYYNYPYGKYVAFPSVKVEVSELINKGYKGFNVSFVERTKILNGEHYDYIIKTVNGEKVTDLSYGSVRAHIDSKISQVLERINGNKQSCLDDVFFTKEKYIKRMQNEPLSVTADSLLINARYNGKQFNWCFEYLYNKGMGIAELAKYL